MIEHRSVLPYSIVSAAINPAAVELPPTRTVTIILPPTTSNLFDRDGSSTVTPPDFR